MMQQRLEESLSYFADSIKDCVRRKRHIGIITHIDCDGLVSGSIMAKALIRAGAICTVSAHKEFGKGMAAQLAADSRDYHIITDFGAGFAGELAGALGENWVAIDHHQLPDEELDSPNVINAWKFGMDGGAEACAGSMAYMAAHALDWRNSDLSALAVVAALGDRQDQGEKKSLTGKNLEISQTAKEEGLVEVDLDLLLAGRETRPLAEALAFTSQPFIEGLTWNRDACLSLLNSAGITLKDGGRWRVPAELSDEEKRTLVESVARYVPGEGATKITSELVGYTYTFAREDGRGFLRDGREFAMMLNSCRRIGKHGVGIAICMGDRTAMLREGEKVLAEYRKMIRAYMNELASDRWRISEGDSCVMVNGQGVVPEAMTGTLSSLIAGSPKNSGKIIILRADGEGNTVKFSSRKSAGCRNGVNLNDLMRRGAEKFDGVGGGHAAAAGARITKDKLDGFLDYIEANVVDMQGSDTAR